jgi:hypothetical protein
MSEDELLRRLGSMVRLESSARFDERWDRLAAGTLDAAEEAELRALCETSEEAREAYEAFRPLGPDFHAGVTRRIQAQAAREAAKPTRFARRARRVGGWGAAAAAAAAAVFLLVRPPPLPDYTLAEVAGASRATRAGATAAAGFAPGDPFVLTLRPETEVTGGGALDARIYLLHRGDLWPIEVRPELDPRGSVRLRGVVPPALEAGGAPLWVVVGREGALPDPAELRAVGAVVARRGRQWTALPVRLPVRPRPP